jgi:hypothetical protein
MASEYGRYLELVAAECDRTSAPSILEIGLQRVGNVAA